MFLRGVDLPRLRACCLKSGRGPNVIAFSTHKTLSKHVHDNLGNQRRGASNDTRQTALTSGYIN